MYEVIFLIVLALIWIIFATVQDIRKREIADWLNFSLIIFALGFRFFYSLFSDTDFQFFYQGLIGFGIFFLLGNLFYYSRLFAGGDAKLMIALGAVLPFSKSFMINVNIFIIFLFTFLIVGAVYGMIWSFVLAFRNWKSFKKEFSNVFKKNKKLVLTGSFVGIVLILGGFLESILIYSGILIFASSYFYIFSKAVDECCMVKKVSSKNLTLGDWIYQDVKVGNKVIKKKWEGLNEDEVVLLKKRNKQVLVRQGIPFAPVFLISFLIIVGFYFLDKIQLYWVF